MKKMLIIMMMFLLWGCSEQVDETLSPSIMQVKVMTTETMTFQDYENYIGVIKGSGILKQGFQSDGQLSHLYVDKGKVVKQGDVIARLDTEGLDFEHDVAKADVASAQAQVDKAVDAYNYAEELLNDTTALLNQGVASQSTFDQVQLNFNVARNDLNAAREQLNRAKTNLEGQVYRLEQSIILAEKDGVVVDTMYEEGEMVPKGYPVVIIRDPIPVVSVGIAQKDLDYGALGNFAKVTINDESFDAEIISISEIPDNITQTYEVELLLNEAYPIGTVVEVHWSTDTVTGTRLPLTAIRSDGIDYVFIARENRAERVEIAIEDIMNQEVIVTGLESGSLLIIEGIMGLSEGQAVEVVEE